MADSVVDILAKHGITVTEDELEHSGVKGMRWGVRKSSSSGGSGGKKSAATRKHQVKSMTDEELKSRIARIKMEKEFLKLTAPELSPGRKAVMNILQTAGKTAAQEYANKAAKDGAGLLYDYLGSAVKSKSAKKAIQLAIEAPK
jgi:hypothetical protein